MEFKIFLKRESLSQFRRPEFGFVPHGKNYPEKLSR